MVKNRLFVDAMKKNIQALAKQEDPVFVSIILAIVLVDLNHLNHLYQLDLNQLDHLNQVDLNHLNYLNHVKNRQIVVRMNIVQDHLEAVISPVHV